MNTFNIILIKISLFIVFFSLSTEVQAKKNQILVGLEPFPPIINQDGTGYGINLLKALEQHSDLKFNVQVMTYARAKKELKEQRLDLIGLTPKASETQEFYQYAQDINWSLNTNVDVFSTSPEYLQLEDLPNKSIGTVTGNADFFAEQAGVARDKFIEVSSLKQLIKMLERGRLNVVIFERVSMMTTIQALNIGNIYYRKFANIPASFAVENTAKGSKLKEQLDTLIKKINTQQYFAQYFQYTNITDSGIVQLKKNESSLTPNISNAKAAMLAQ